jgi:hypothetical protein
MTDEEMEEKSKRLKIESPKQMFEKGLFLGDIRYELLWITHDDFTEEEAKDLIKKTNSSEKPNS